MHELDPFFELRLLVLRRRLERALEVVEHRQELVQQALVRAAEELGLVARDALAVVVEVGREAQVGLVVDDGRRISSSGSSSIRTSSTGPLRRLDLLVLEPGLERLVGHEVFASSSSSMTS